MMARLRESARREVRDVLWRTSKQLVERGMLVAPGADAVCLVCGATVEVDTADGHADGCVVGDVGDAIREWLEAERREKGSR